MFLKLMICLELIGERAGAPRCEMPQRSMHALLFSLAVILRCRALCRAARCAFIRGTPGARWSTARLRLYRSMVASSGQCVPHAWRENRTLLRSATVNPPVPAESTIGKERFAYIISVPRMWPQPSLLVSMETFQSGGTPRFADCREANAVHDLLFAKRIELNVARIA